MTPEQDISEIEFEPNCFNDGGDKINSKDIMRIVGDLDTMTAAQIAAVFAHVKNLKEAMEAELKELSGFFELIKTVKLPEAFDRENVKTFTLQNGTRVTKAMNTFCSIIGPQHEAHDWLKENGYPDAVKPTVNSSTLKGIAGEILGEHEEGYNGPVDLPDHLFRVEIRPTTSVTKGRK